MQVLLRHVEKGKLERYLLKEKYLNLENPSKIFPIPKEGSGCSMEGEWIGEFSTKVKLYSW